MRKSQNSTRSHNSSIAKLIRFFANRKNIFGLRQLAKKRIGEVFGDFGLIYWFHSKDPDVSMRRPQFERGAARVEAAKLKKFSDAGDLKLSGCPTPGDLGPPIERSVYRAQNSQNPTAHSILCI